MPDNTSNGPIFPVGPLSQPSTPGRIEAQETEGQRQLVEDGGSEIPVRTQGCTDADLVALGFTLGETKPDDPVFRAGALPSGWTIQATDHSMHSRILDEKGRTRGGIFYKAAFYDRSAHITLRRRYTRITLYGPEYAHDPFPQPDLKKGQTRYGVGDDETDDVAWKSTAVVDGFNDNEGDQKAREEQGAWLSENFPDYNNPLAYWSE